MNIAELLKNALPGLKLYSPVCGDCTFQKVEGGDIFVLGDREYIFQFDGRYGTNGECLLFPSKDKMDWSDFKLPVKVLEEGALVMFSTYENPISFI